MEIQRSLLTALRTALEDFENDAEWNSIIQLASIKNRWFEPEGISQSLNQWRNSLQSEALQSFLLNYQWPNETEIKSANSAPILGLILAGNIPLVGLQDVINGVLCGYKLKVKRSSEDEVLISFLIDRAAEIEPLWKQQIQWSDDLKTIDAAIATGSNNSSRYFDYYFRNIPHIIRKNRNSVAILTGNESPEEIEALGTDVFNYFGLGCRNVTHILLPDGYDLANIFSVWDPIYLNSIVHHNKYVNNYHYHKSLLLMNLDPHVDTGYVIAKESTELYAPVGMLHYSFYEDIKQATNTIKTWGDTIQVVVTNALELTGELEKNNLLSVGLGESQCTTLCDFADNIDTVQWLLSNNSAKATQ